MKIKTLCVLVLLMLGASLASAQTITRCGGPNTIYINWPTFQFDDCRTGYNPYETRLNVGNVQNLVLAWQYSTNGYVTGAPALVNGVLYFGSYSPATIRAVNALTGALIWQYTIAGEGPDGSSPAVVNGAVYLGASDGNVYALDANTGTLLWKYTTGNGIVRCSPAVTNGVVYIGSGDRNMYALNAKTGALLWKYDTFEIVGAPPAVVNGIVYFVTTSGNLYALNAGNGTLLWKYAVGGNPQIYPPIVIDGVLYYANHSEYLSAFNAQTGTLLWKTRPNESVALNDIAVANGIVYGVGASYIQDYYFPTIYAFDAKTGKQLWICNFTDNATQGVVVANGVLYAISYPFESGPTLLAVDASTGAFLARRPLQGAPTSPVIANGFVYLDWYDGQGRSGAYAYHLPNQ